MSIFKFEIVSNTNGKFTVAPVLVVADDVYAASKLAEIQNPNSLVIFKA
jgi:hypothetical protein